MSNVENLIDNVSLNTLINFCREKSGDFMPQTDIHFESSNRDLFGNGFNKHFASVSVAGFFPKLQMFVFFVKLDPKQELSERSCRRMQYDFARKILTSADQRYYNIMTGWANERGAEVDSVGEGLFVFTDGLNFRFSFIQNVNAKTDTVVRRFRRFTFFVEGPNGDLPRESTNRTFREQMAKPWTDSAALQEAFSVQKVSDEFFDAYKAHYEKFVAFCGAKSVRDQFVRFGYADPDKATRDYVKKLLGRLVFLKFLEKKGWLGVPEEGKWGDGDRRYIVNLFNAKKERREFKDNFLDLVLEPLFFETLNERRKKDLASAVLSPTAGERVRIPYLNGGLFERDKGPDGTVASGSDATSIKFPDKLFEDLFDTFDRFNFTIDENGPEDAEIGVDPEMLSRIFESLLEENRKKDGAIYTPKEIVEYMCSESLIAYLGDTPANRKLVTTLDVPDNLAADEKEALQQKLADVKICDPAIGSGAFPMGMLNILYRLRHKLNGGEETSEKVVALKKEIIKNNLYGVDIEAGAVDIARLRFWLSIVVDENEPFPLPNLDYKIMQGNSLLESYGGVDLSHVLEGGGSTIKTRKGKKAKRDVWQREFAFDAETAVQEIQRDKDELFGTTDHTRKEQLTARIASNVRSYLQYKVDAVHADEVAKMQIPNDKFCLWHLFFADVFKNGGFDIVVGNPPYFNVETLGAKSIYAENVKATYPEIWQDKSDILFYFFGLAFRLSKNVIMYITSNAYPFSDKASKLRNEMLSDGRLKRIVNFEKYKIFKKSKTPITTCITLLDQSREDFTAVNYKDDGGALPSVIEYISNEENAYRVALRADSVFALVNDIATGLNAKIDGRHQMLCDIEKVGSGMQTAANPVFCFSTLPSQFPREYVRCQVCGKGITKYNFTPKGKYLLYVEDVAEFAELPIAIQQYLRSNKHILEKRAQIKRSKNSTWWKFVFPMHKEYYHLDKIWTSYRAKRNEFAFDDTGRQIGLTNTTVIFDTNKEFNLKYILALLNSKLLEFRYRSIGKQTGGGVYEYFKNGVGKLPIPTVSLTRQMEFVALVDQILAAKKQDPSTDTSELEKKIDRLVYKLYGLTDAEIAIVEGTLSASGTKGRKASAQHRNAIQQKGKKKAEEVVEDDDDGSDARD